jgi:hypothetical protein
VARPSVNSAIFIWPCNNCSIARVALKGDALPVVVICELKLTFNLELILQGVDRATTSDEVWLAARLSARGKGRESDASLTCAESGGAV